MPYRANKPSMMDEIHATAEEDQVLVESRRFIN